MMKEHMKGTLHLLLIAIAAMKYVHGSRLPTTLPSLPPPEDTETNPTLIPPSSSALAATRLSFFMHDIFGGSAPSLRVVSGIVAANQAMSGIPFSKPNGGVFPKTHGVPLITANNNGLNGNNNLIITKGKRLPFVTAGQLPQGATLQKLFFGTITVIDDELTEGHELGSSIIGKAQGFYLASSMDGSSHTMAFTAMFHENDGDDHHDGGDDTISFFGVHRTAAVESHIAIVGGTGKYENAGGYAIIETLHHTNEHTTDGIDTLLHFSVFLTNY